MVILAIIFLFLADHPGLALLYALIWFMTA